VRYRFYVSSAILTGRHDEAGSVTRVSASDLENSIVSALRERFANLNDLNDKDLIRSQIQRIVLGQTKLQITTKTDNQIELARPQLPTSTRARIETENCHLGGEPDVSLINALGRAHLWLKALTDGTYKSIKELANVAKWNPKVVRKALRLAFLAPDITEAIILGSQPKSLSLSELQAVAAHSWDEQRSWLRIPTAA
jgi:site-specific DNA recombinase